MSRQLSRRCRRRRPGLAAYPSASDSARSDIEQRGEPADAEALDRADPPIDEEKALGAEPFACTAYDLAQSEDPPFDPPDDDDLLGEALELSPDDATPCDRGELLLVDIEGGAAGKAARFSANPDAPPSEPRRAPHISIHASWDRLDIARQLGEFAADWRMARAEVTLERGGVEGAAARFRTDPDPDLLIVDTTLTGRELLASLAQFAPMVTRGAKIIVIGAVNDITLLRQLAARGMIYVVPPFTPDELVRMVCERFAAMDRSRVIAVIGARGGVGASTIAHNLAWSIAEQQRAEAVLVDFDLCFSAATLHLEQRPAQSIADALSEPRAIDDDSLERLASKRGSRLKVLAAPGALELDSDINPEAVQMFIKSVRRISAFAVLDLPHMWAPWIRNTLLAADDVVIVATPDLASLRDAKRLLDLLKAARPDGCAPHVVLSMVGIPKRPEILAKDFADSLEAEPAATFAFDPNLFDTAALRGLAVGEAAPHAPTARKIAEFASALTGREAAQLMKPARVTPETVRSAKPRPVDGAVLMDRPFTFAPPPDAGVEPPIAVAYPAPGARRPLASPRAASVARQAKRAKRGSVRVALALMGLLYWGAAQFGDGLSGIWG